MFEVTSESIERLSAHDPRTFTRLMNELIRAEAKELAIPDAAIGTTLNITEPDGGMDATAGKPRRKRSEEYMSCENGVAGSLGYFEERTVWQFKSSVKKRDLEEIKKPAVQALISRGHAYRLCIGRDLTPNMKTEWQETLLTYAKGITPNPAHPAVLTASDIAAWLCRYPALVLRFIYPDLKYPVYDMQRWQKEATASARDYVEIPEHKDAIERIHVHVDFARNVGESVLTIEGDPGVGKTRAAFEALSSLDSMRRMVVYVKDDNTAREVANVLVQRSAKAVLVADDCSTDVRLYLEMTLRPYADHVRAIALSHPTLRSYSIASLPQMSPLSPQSTQDILTKNFPCIPEVRRLYYAEVCKGYPKLCLEFCRNDAVIANDALRQSPSAFMHNYVTRLIGTHIDVVALLSLLPKVGVTGEVKAQIEHLCTLAGKTDVASVRDVAHSVKDSTGFVAEAGRYMYVTPLIVAQYAFNYAWERWMRRDVAGFAQNLSRLSLTLPFLDQLSRVGNGEARQAFGDFFRERFSRLTPRELADEETTDQFLALCETSPQTYLPLMTSVLEEASDDELRAISPHSTRRGSWGPWRRLVWLVERLMVFPKMFLDAERILLRLALAENEPRIGNNATNIWLNSFRIFLSGTSLPFEDRIELLEARVSDKNESVSALALRALDNVLSYGGIRIQGPPVVAGRIAPTDWHPASRKEEEDCQRMTLDLLEKVVASTIPRACDSARKIVLSHVRRLLWRGALEELRHMLTDMQSDPEAMSQAISQIDAYLVYDVGSGRTKVDAAYVVRVEEWRRSLRPEGVQNRLLFAVAQEPWGGKRLHDQKATSDEDQLLARELLAQPDAVHRNLDFLFSSRARNAFWIGRHLGQEDTSRSLIEPLILASVGKASQEFARGYVAGVVKSGAVDETELNSLIDRVQADDPAAALALASAAGDLAHVFDRAVALVGSKRLPPYSLTCFTAGIGARALSLDELRAILDLLATAAEAGDTDAVNLALQIVDVHSYLESRRDLPKAVEHAGCLEATWRILELGLQSQDRIDPHLWASSISKLFPVNFPRASRLISAALTLPELGYHDAVVDVGASAAGHAPEIFIGILGEYILDKKRGDLFYLLDYRKVIASLPPDVVKNWIAEHGIRAARLLARHVPSPYVTANGNPVVPDLTYWLLKEYGGDKRVFGEFCAGVHSFQWYSGDIAKAHEREAEDAQKFLSHELPAVRNWAQQETLVAQQEARWHRQRTEEQYLP